MNLLILNDPNALKQLCLYQQQHQQWQCWFWWKIILTNQEQGLLQKVCC